MKIQSHETEVGPFACARSKCSLKKCLAQIQTSCRNVIYLILEGEKCSLTKLLWGHEPSKPSCGKESGMFSGSTSEEYGLFKTIPTACMHTYYDTTHENIIIGTGYRK